MLAAPMYISRVRIENIRCFGSGEQAVDLDLRRPDGSYAGWTVIAGRNGAGKTTFLRALALITVGLPGTWAFQESSMEWVRHGAAEGIARLVLLPDSRTSQTRSTQRGRPGCGFRQRPAASPSSLSFAVIAVLAFKPARMTLDTIPGFLYGLSHDQNRTFLVTRTEFE